MKYLTFNSITEITALAMNKEAGEDLNRLYANARLADVGGSNQDLREYYGHHNRSCQDIADAPGNPPKHILEAVEKARQQLADKVKPPQRKRRKVRRNLADGAELDPQAWLERNPEGWSEIVHHLLESRLAKIAVNVTVSAGEHLDRLKWRGAIAAALADLLTAAGVSVEITALVCIRGFSSDMPALTCEVRVKEADTPLDMGAVAVALADAAFFRCVMLNALARKSTGMVSGWMGYPESASKEVAERFDLVLGTDLTDRNRAEQFATAAMTGWQNN